MAKKKRRYRKNRRVVQRPRVPNDVHHLLWIGKKWGFGDLAALRQFWYCKVSIPRETLHHYIHENIANIPTPKPENAKDALRQLQYLESYQAIHDTDGIERRLQVIIALFEGVEPRTVDALKRQLEVIHEFYQEPP